MDILQEYICYSNAIEKLITCPGGRNKLGTKLAKTIDNCFCRGAQNARSAPPQYTRLKS